MSLPGAASQQGWRNSPLHREVDSRNARWVFKVVLGVAIALTPLAVYLLQTMAYVETSYAIERARGLEAQLVEREHRLTIERDALESLPEVEKHSGARLGLVRPPVGRVVVVAPGELGRPVPDANPSYRPPSR